MVKYLTLLFALFIFSAANAQNDTCLAAIPVSCGMSYTGSTLLATDVDQPPHCNDSIEAPGVWYSLMGTDDLIIIDMCGSSYDTKINVYEGTCDSLTCVASNDDDDICPNLQSYVDFDAALGTQYFIYINGYDGDTGDFAFTVICEPAPVNDLCTDALPILCGSSYVGRTYLATNTDEPPTCEETIEAPGIWYSFQGNNMDVNLNLCASNYDTKVTVYSGNCTSYRCVGGNDDSPNCDDYESEYDFFAMQNVNYLIYISGYDGEVGNAAFDVTCTEPVPCAISQVRLGIQGPCNPLTNTYTQEVTVTHSNAPNSGMLEVNGQVFGIAPSPQIINLVGLEANGAWENIFVSFTSDSLCGYALADALIAPMPCNTTGIADRINSLPISVYPNPTSGLLSISLASVEPQEASLKLYNSIGQVVFSEAINIDADYYGTIDCSKMQAGVYTLMIEGTQNTGIRKIVVE